MSSFTATAVTPNTGWYNGFKSFGTSAESMAEAVQNFVTTTTTTTTEFIIDPWLLTTTDTHYYPTVTTPTYTFTNRKIRTIHKCEYCGSSYDDDTEFVTNCKNCGAIIRREE